MRPIRYLLVFLTLMLAGPAVATVSGMASLGRDWHSAGRRSVGLAPAPATTAEPVLQIYGARAFGWRGAFAVHTWIAAKRVGAPSYTTYQVIGWHLWHGSSALVVREGVPDRQWYGSAPQPLNEGVSPVGEGLILWIGARERCASLTMCTICDSSEL